MFNWSPFDQNVTWVRWFLVLPRRARPSVASCCQLDGWQTASVLEQKVRQVERLQRMSFSPFHLEASWSNKSNDGSLMDRTFQHIRLGMLKCHWTSSIQPQHWGSTPPFRLLPIDPVREGVQIWSAGPGEDGRKIWKSSRNQLDQLDSWPGCCTPIVLSTRALRVQQWSTPPGFTIVYQLNDPNVHHRCSSMQSMFHCHSMGISSFSVIHLTGMGWSNCLQKIPVDFGNF